MVQSQYNDSKVLRRAKKNSRKGINNENGLAKIMDCSKEKLAANKYSKKLKKKEACAHTKRNVGTASVDTEISTNQVLLLFFTLFILTKYMSILNIYILSFVGRTKHKR